VLVRTNADADPILRALSVRGVGWRFSGASGLYARPAVRLLQSFLRAVADPDATVDVYALATAEPYRLGGEDLSRIVETARRTNRSLWTVLGEVAEGRPPHLSPETRRGAQRLVDDLRSSMDLAHERPAGEVLYEFLRRTGTLATLAAGGPGVEESLLDIARFFEIIRRESSLLQDPRVPFVARHLRTLVEAGDDPSAPDVDEPAAGVVSVLTVHKAKGLEFRSVFVAGMADGRFPLRGRPEALPFLPNLAAGDRVRIDELAEERRLCYVAMTRARDELILTSAADTGGRRLRRASPFIAEALDELGVSQPAGTDPLARLERAGNPAPDPVTLVPGGIPGGALSFTQLEDYIACPARYRYRHVLRLPVPPHHAISYGVALHEALAAFGRSQIQGRPLSEEGLLEGFARAWSGEGFLSREHEEARLAAGRQALVRCRERLLAAPGWPVAVEEPFAMVLDGIRVQGRFDRIDETPDGIVITDFKSSDVRDPVRARERARDSLQLALYALAWQAREGSLPHAVQLSFVDSGVIGRVTPDRGRMARAAGKVRSVADGVLVGSFSATPGAVTCGFCPFHEICPSSAV
jgi:DNA helicase-2/ATP-dependent DNA helicase PcrA